MQTRVTGPGMSGCDGSVSILQDLSVGGGDDEVLVLGERPAGSRKKKTKAAASRRKTTPSGHQPGRAKRTGQDERRQDEEETFLGDLHVVPLPVRPDIRGEERQARGVGDDVGIDTVDGIARSGDRPGEDRSNGS